ncbi:GtrA family protein [Smaragdicoccus niigatensis]|uniref:GtrA family protein n=1 Tax=Smaragdicoccus niigatensis TaxID=359359 RepID=UPI000361435E|nr:GtrA family protein [Smaragdicoccus niigatensis]
MDGGVLDRPTVMGRVWGLLTSQQFAFLVVGGINTLVGFLAFVAWIKILGEHFYSLAVVLAYCVSIVVAFGLHRTFVFKVRGQVLGDFVRFVGVNSTGLVLNIALMFAFVTLIGLPPIPSQFVVLGLVAIASFFGHRHISFRRSPVRMP